MDKAKAPAPVSISKAKVAIPLANQIVLDISFKRIVIFLPYFKVERIEVDPAKLDNMIEAMRDHRFEVMTILLKQEYQRTILKQQERMLADIGQEAVPV